MTYRGLITVLALGLCLCLISLVTTPVRVLGQEAAEEAELVEHAVSGVPRFKSNVLTWNMCNGLSGGCGNGGLDAPARHLIERLGRDGLRPPLSVAVQEMCTASWNYLRVRFEAMGYVAARYWSNPNTGSDCGQHGNAVFWAGSSCGVDCVWRGAYPTAHQYHDDGVMEADRRGYVCGTGLFPQFSTCSSHLTSRSDYGAGQQAVDYREAAGDLAVYTPTFASGDFNILPSHSALDGFYTWWREGSRCGQDRQSCPPDTHSSEGHIDYVFTRRSWDQCFEHPAYIWNSPRSDHHFFYGYIASGSACA